MPSGSTHCASYDLWVSLFPASSPLAFGLTAGSCSYGREFAIRFFRLHLTATPCVSLRLPSSAPVGSFHPTRFCPCWAHWGGRPRPQATPWSPIRRWTSDIHWLRLPTLLVLGSLRCSLEIRDAGVDCHAAAKSRKTEGKVRPSRPGVGCGPGGPPYFVSRTRRGWSLGRRAEKVLRFWYVTGQSRSREISNGALRASAGG